MGKQKADVLSLDHSSLEGGQGTPVVPFLWLRFCQIQKPQGGPVNSRYPTEIYSRQF